MSRTASIILGLRCTSSSSSIYICQAVHISCVFLHIHVDEIIWMCVYLVNAWYNIWIFVLHAIISISQNVNWKNYIRKASLKYAFHVNNQEQKLHLKFADSHFDHLKQSIFCYRPEKKAIMVITAWINERGKWQTGHACLPRFNL